MGRGEKVEFAAIEKDSCAVVDSISESTGIGFERLDFGVEENPFEKPPKSAVAARSDLKDSSNHTILVAPAPDESSSILKAFPRIAGHESKLHRNSASCEPSTPDSP